jgi:hypothetical protein
VLAPQQQQPKKVGPESTSSFMLEASKKNDCLVANAVIGWTLAITCLTPVAAVAQQPGEYCCIRFDVIVFLLLIFLKSLAACSASERKTRLSDHGDDCYRSVQTGSRIRYA